MLFCKDQRLHVVRYFNIVLGYASNTFYLEYYLQWAVQNSICDTIASNFKQRTILRSIIVIPLKNLHLRLVQVFYEKSLPRGNCSPAEKLRQLSTELTSSLFPLEYFLYEKLKNLLFFQDISKKRFHWITSECIWPPLTSQQEEKNFTYFSIFCSALQSLMSFIKCAYL